MFLQKLVPNFHFSSNIENYMPPRSFLVGFFHFQVLEDPEMLQIMS